MYLVLFYCIFHMYKRTPVSVDLARPWCPVDILFPVSLINLICCDLTISKSKTVQSSIVFISIITLFAAENIKRRHLGQYPKDGRYVGAISYTI